LERDEELEYLLYALNDRMNTSNPTPAIIGSYMAVISHWLAKNEQRIIEFVNSPNPSKITQSDLKFDEVLLQTTFWLACLTGNLSFSEQSSSDIFLSLVEFANKPIYEDKKGLRSKLWHDKLNAVMVDIKDVCAEFLNAFNCPQGSSSEVRFLDAQRAISYIKDFRSQQFKLQFEIDEEQGTLWEKVSRVYKKLKPDLDLILEAEYNSFLDIQNNISHYLGETTPKDFFSKLADFISYCQENSFYVMPIDEKLTGRKLEKQLELYNKLPELAEPEKLCLWLSEYITQKEDLKSYLELFKNLEGWSDKQIEKITQGLLSSENSNINNQRQSTLKIYEALIKLTEKLSERKLTNVD
jgi:hypothetical protein